MDVKIMKTKAQERYGNTSGIEVIFINRAIRGTSES
jgi:hypothetical protein